MALASTTPRPCCSQRSTYIFTLHQPTLKPNIGGKTNCVGVVPETVKLLIGVHYKCKPFLPSQLFRYWARVTLLSSVPTNQRAYHQGAQAAFSDFCVRDIHSYPQARYFTHGFSVCLHQQSLQLLLIFYLLLATEEIRTPSIITFANDATLSVVTVLLSEPTQPLFTTPMARRILQFACYREPSVLLDSSRALSLKRILGQYIYWCHCCSCLTPK
jgi:hypothetical protein